MTTEANKEIKEITVENCRVILASYMEKENVSAPSISKAMRCSHATIDGSLAE